MKRFFSFFRTFGALHRSIHWWDLAVFLAAPVFGVTIRYFLPIVQKLIIFFPDLRPYQKALDSLLMMISAFSLLYPFVLCGVEERMNGIALSLTISPLRSSGYFICRYLMPCVYAAIYAFLMELCFSPVERPLLHTVLCCLLAAPVALTGMLAAPVLTNDKLDGIILLKFTVVIFLAIPSLLGHLLPLFLQPVFLLCPAYWLMRFVAKQDWLMAVMSLATALLWLGGSYSLWSRSLKQMRFVDSWE
ncbi:MAG: hypothetical protein E7331_03150 [Clostridiales bacterium]|nr:hypothetical protein [Clostridiales bacterium]